MLSLRLSLALVAMPTWAYKAPAGYIYGWSTDGSTTVQSTQSCHPYSTSLILQEGATATFTVHDLRKVLVQGRKRSDSPSVAISIDGGQPVIYNFIFDNEQCIDLGPFGPSNPRGEHNISVFVPDQRGGEFMFELFGLDVTQLTGDDYDSLGSPSSIFSTIVDPSGTSSRNSTSSPPPAPSLSISLIFGVSVTIITGLCLIGLLVFRRLRRRRNGQKVTEAAMGRTALYGLEAGGRFSIGELAPVMTTAANDKLRAVLSADNSDNESEGNPTGDARHDDVPFAASIDPSDPTRALLAQRAAAPSDIPLSTSTAVASASGPTTNGAVVPQPDPEPEMRELYQAMHQAGFTVHTLFERLRRNVRRSVPVVDTDTVVSHGSAGEPLPRYDVAEFS